jgi:hypothetical protein
VRSPELGWGQLLVPYLESALIHAGTYSSEEISGHASFFLDYISPYLGPAPIGDNHHGELGYKPRYGSAMTKDLTPFELSLCWKSYKQEYKPIVRFITDIIPSNLETTRVASLTQSLNLIETLKRVAESESTTQPLHVLPDLWKVISRSISIPVATVLVAALRQPL